MAQLTIDVKGLTRDEVQEAIDTHIKIKNMTPEQRRARIIKLLTRGASYETISTEGDDADK
jgi:hypothetical protein